VGSLPKWKVRNVGNAIFVSPCRFQQGTFVLDSHVCATPQLKRRIADFKAQRLSIGVTRAEAGRQQGVHFHEWFDEPSGRTVFGAGA